MLNCYEKVMNKLFVVVHRNYPLEMLWYKILQSALNWRSRDVRRTSKCGRHLGTFLTRPLDVSQKLYASIEAVFLYMFAWTSLCLPIVNIEKTTMEIYLKNYGRKWRLGDVSIMLVCLRTFLQNAVNIKTCSAFSILVNEDWE